MSQQLPVPQLQFNTDDKGGTYLDKLNQISTALRGAITLFNSQVQAGQNATVIKSTLEQIQRDVQAISESGLPAQQQKAFAALVTNGTATGWQYTSGFNRGESNHFTLDAGSRALVTATKAINVALPKTVSLLQPFYMKNAKTSPHDVLISVPSDATYVIKGKKDINPGDTIRFKPGSFVSMQCTKNNIVEILG